jgi:hypothetical protein
MSMALFLLISYLENKFKYFNLFSEYFSLQVWPFTNWTRSSFYSSSGIQVEAPVFNELPRLPTPLGSFIYTSPYFRFAASAIGSNKLLFFEKIYLYYTEYRIHT